MSRKTKLLVNGLTQARSEFARIGTRKVKLALNKLAKTDPYAYALRVALEIEDARTKLPESLWQAAVELARQHGCTPSRTRCGWIIWV
jgi:hypothetical protein